MDGLGVMLTSLGVGCKVGKKFSNNIWYADDLVLLTPTVTALQQMINLCHEYAREHNICFNEKKTVCMRFGCSNAKLLGFPNVSLYNKTLHWVDNFCYLGYNMSSSFKYYDYSEIDKRCHTMRVRANMLASRFSKVSEDVKKLLFKTYFSSIYCSSLWIPQTQKCLQKIRVTFNDCFRIIFKVKGPHSISNEFVRRGICNFEARRRICCFSLIKRVLFPKNEIVLDIVNCTTFYRTVLYQEWIKILYV